MSEDQEFQSGRDESRSRRWPSRGRFVLARTGQRRALRRNDIYCKKLPRAFDGFTLLHMTDFHADMNDGAVPKLEAILPGLSYDLCVLTGDYRGATFGKFDEALARMRPVLARIKRSVYGVLGNHDTIRMVPDGDSHAAQ